MIRAAITDARAFLGRRSQCPAGGDSTRSTAPESRVLRAAIWHRRSPTMLASTAGRAGTGAGEGRA
jgi:hypothetical protein